MFKIMFIGDPHFQVENIPEVNLFIDKLEELIKKENPNLICIAGDILHTHEILHTIPLNKAYEFIDRLRKLALTYVLIGNHDAINNQIFLNDNHWMNGMKEWNNVVIVDKIQHYFINSIPSSAHNDLHFVFCPYVPPGRFEEALNTDKDWKSATCIFAHQEFFGCKMGAIVSAVGDKWPLNYPNIVSGHIHSKQKPQNNIYYSGSAMQHAFGESEENIIPIFTWDKDKNYTLVEHDLQLPRKKIIYTDVEKIEEYKPTLTQDKIKLSLSGNYDEFKAFKKTKKYRELINSGTKVVFKPKKQEVKENNEKIESYINSESSETEFIKILSSLINEEKNPYLFQVHELVINGRNISKDDVIFYD